MDEIRIGEKVYISSKRAAEVTGYAKDYVGQLCREGHVEAKMVGRSWYVFEPSIREHRFGKEIQSSEEHVGNQTVDDLHNDSEDSDAASNETGTEIAAESNENAGTDTASVQQWERPTYKPEPVYTIPEIQESEKVVPAAAARPINALESPEYRHALEESSLTDMQKAWKEWFEHKQSGQPEAIQEQQEFQNEQEAVQEEENEYEQEHELQHEQEAVEEETPIAITAIKPQEELPDRVHQAEGEFRIPVRKLATETEYAAQGAIHGQNPYQDEARVVSERIIARNSDRKVQKFPVVGAHKTSAKKKVKGGAVIARALLISVSIIAITIALIGSGIADNYLKSISTENPAGKAIKLITGERTIQKDNK